MDFQEMIKRLMQQSGQHQSPVSDGDMQRIQQMQAQEQEQARRNQMMQQQMQQNRLRQVPPEAIQMLQQQLPQSAPAASPEMMMERGGRSGHPLGPQLDSDMAEILKRAIAGKLLSRGPMEPKVQAPPPRLQDELQLGAGGWLPLQEQHMRMNPQKVPPASLGPGYGVQR
jgi:hypothetical protein